MKKFILFGCLLLLLGGCYSIKNKVEDVVRGWDTCTPVTEACVDSPEEFYAIPIIRSQETWRGKTADELVAAWGLPDRMEKLPDSENIRYVWVDKFTTSGEMRYDHDNWNNEWTLVRKPDQLYECETYMEVDVNNIITPSWVNRLGVCNEFFSPRQAYIPQRKATKK